MTVDEVCRKHSALKLCISEFHKTSRKITDMELETE